jgi:protein-disulfide isomerase
LKHNTLTRAILAPCAVLIFAAGCKKTASAPAATGASPGAKMTAATLAREARILDTLKFKIPNLSRANPVIGELKPSPYAGLDEGTLTVSMPQAPPQSQKFYLTQDNKALFLAEPLDASRGLQELRAERDTQFATLTAGLPVRGNPSAQFTIVEFSDFQCPYCQQAYQVVMQVLKRHPADVRFIYKQYPLSELHPWASLAAQISSCAARQKPAAFWKLHDAYFDRQREITPQNLQEISHAAVAGEKLDEVKWKDCIDNPASPDYQAVKSALAASVKDGEPLGVRGTPTFFLNGRAINMGPPEMFDSLIEDAKAGKD